MPPQLLQFGLFALEEAIKLEPGIAAELKTLFSKGDPTPADWQALRARVTSNPYEKYDSTPINVPVKVLPAPAEAMPSAQPPQAPPANPTNAPASLTPPASSLAAIPAQAPITAVQDAAPGAAVVSSAAPANVLQLPAAPPPLTELEIRQQIQIDELKAQLAGKTVTEQQPPAAPPVAQEAPAPAAAVTYDEYHG